MAKCIKCGKSTLVRGHVKLADGAICTPCFKSLGFKLTETAAAAYYKYDQIKDGKDAFYKKKAAEAFERSSFPNEEDYRVHGVSFENEDGQNIQQILSEYVEEECDDFKLSASEIKEQLEYEDQVYVYQYAEIEIQLDPTMFDGEPAVKVYGEIEPEVFEHIGWIPKRKAQHVIDILNTTGHVVSGEIVGGPFKYIDDDGKICSDRHEFGCRVYLSY